MKSLVIVISIHHDNTVKIGQTIAKVLNAPLKNPKKINPDDLNEFDMVGFGSGVYGAQHHESLLKLAESLPQISDKKAFLFSTGGISSERKALEDHKKLRVILESKGYVIVDNFQCKGFNTNSFLKYFGGMNKGRPNAVDHNNAEVFAQNLIDMMI
jgi:flavodoxin